MQILHGSISDDSGFIGLIDPAAYQKYLDSESSFETKAQHFLKEMNCHHLLFWGTGLEGTWKFSVMIDAPVPPNAFRSFSAQIDVSAGRLCLINYESLSMAARFQDVELPEPHLSSCCFSLDSGSYAVSVFQLFDPSSSDCSTTGIDFELHLKSSHQLASNWSYIPWFEG